MAILFSSTADNAPAWIAALTRHLPGETVRVWPDIGAPEAIEFAVVWQPPAGMLARLPKLRAILSLGAGIDHLTSDPALPRHVPLVRLIDPSLTSQMSEYVVMNVLRHHRHMIAYAEQQAAGQWRPLLPAPDTTQRRVGLMGFGVLGRDAADKLKPFGFPLRTWTHRPHDLGDVQAFHGDAAHGDAALNGFLSGCDILVWLLPLSETTRGILNHAHQAALPRAAARFNAARGGNVVTADLLAALESGQISGATLDVTDPEPLPPDHPLWRHPRVTITPHVASLTLPETAAAVMADSIRRIRAGQPVPGQVDLARGY
jgi:glyoxylate/hydroxypyruvate reductase A